MPFNVWLGVLSATFIQRWQRFLQNKRPTSRSTRSCRFPDINHRFRCCRLLLLGTVIIKHWQACFHTFKNEAESRGTGKTSRGSLWWLHTPHLWRRARRLVNHIHARAHESVISESFEVTVDGKLAYSKLETGRLPDPAQVSPPIMNGKSGASPTEISQLLFYFLSFSEQVAAKVKQMLMKWTRMGTAVFTLTEPGVISSHNKHLNIFFGST